MHVNKIVILYESILVRTSLHDSGEIPRTPPLEESPDVAPVGATPIADPVTYFTDSYDQNVAKPVVAAQRNLVYVRGKNLDQKPQTGKVYLYWAEQKDLNFPGRWQGNQLLTVGGHGSGTVADVPPDGIAVATDPFEWQPADDLAGKEVALLGVIATAEHPNPIPGLGPWIDFSRWISNNGEVGAFRTTVQAPPKPVATFVTTGNFVLTNAAGTVAFTLRAVKLPLQSIVSFKCSEPDSQGQPIQLPPQKITSDPFVAVVEATVPANFSTTLTFDLSLPARAVAAADNTLSVAATQTPPPSGGPVKPILFAQYQTQIKAPVTT